MKFSPTIIFVSIVVSAIALPLPQADDEGGLSLQEIDALTPQFGHDANVNPTGTGDCDGAVNGPDGQPIKVPCDCPPPRDQFIQSLAANIAAGHAVNNPSVPLTFPTGDSTDDVLARFNAAAVTLQNFKGLGVGCPIASTTWTAQAFAIQNSQAPAPPAPAPSTSAPAPAPTTSAPAPTPTTSQQAPAPTQSAPASGGGADDLTLAQIDALTPQFGHAANVNPTGTGDCDGAVNGSDGKPIKVPCDCPPPRDQFIQSLAANIAAGHAVNNPSVAVTFPTGDSTNDILGRFTAASITLQNLNGPGQGCPIASTTFSAQVQAIQNGQAQAPAPAASTPAAAPASPVASQPAPATSAPSKPANNNGGGAEGLSLAQIDALTPQFGHNANVNPTGTGDCDGAVNGADGKPIKVPCACPPPRDQFIQSLAANINAGRAVNNPSVGLSFPTDNSKNSQITRIQAALVTLQNLNGPGKGCPASSTTFSAQLKALTG